MFALSFGSHLPGLYGGNEPGVKRVGYETCLCCERVISVVVGRVDLGEGESTFTCIFPTGPNSGCSCFAARFGLGYLDGFDSNFYLYFLKFRELLKGELKVGGVDGNRVITHEKTDFGKSFGLNFFFHDRVIFPFCPCRERFGEDIVSWFVVSDFEPNPRTASFLKPDFVDVFFKVFTGFWELLSFF